jgi:hypothetical protein
MVQKFVVPLLLIGFLFLPACIKPVIFTPTADEQRFTPTNPVGITFSTNQTTDKANKELGYVFAQGTNWTEALKLARTKASEIGGNAIIRGRGSVQVIYVGTFFIVPIYQVYYYAEGMVIKYE